MAQIFRRLHFLSAGIIILSRGVHYAQVYRYFNPKTASLEGVHGNRENVTQQKCDVFRWFNLILPFCFRKG